MDELKRARLLLGIDADATRAEVHGAFRKAAKVHHPDAGGDAGAFVDAHWAHRIALVHARPDTRSIAGRHWYLDKVDPNAAIPRVVGPRRHVTRTRVVAPKSFAAILANQLRGERTAV
ncbi:MAG: hypothetical protein GY708_24455 [Actinomycetia bacterium]|nr:hypothetical protein [Actinomycetes bacterium]MCP4957733.1 hypothetical protein [Actinomycetes bacterium]